VRRKTTFEAYLCKSEFGAEVSNGTREGCELALRATLVTEEPVTGTSGGATFRPIRYAKILNSRKRRADFFFPFSS
jgi:hypothetical protein